MRLILITYDDDMLHWGCVSHGEAEREAENSQTKKDHKQNKKKKRKKLWLQS